MGVDASVTVNRALELDFAGKHHTGRARLVDVVVGAPLDVEIAAEQVNAQTPISQAIQNGRDPQGSVASGMISTRRASSWPGERPRTSGNSKLDVVVATT